MRIVLIILLLTLAGCSSLSQTDEKSGNSSFVSPISADDQGYEDLIRTLSRPVSDRWDDVCITGTKRLVKYSDDFDSRIEIDFENGQVKVSTLSRSLLRDAIIMTLLAPDNPDSVDVFSADNMILGEEPMLFRQVLDHEGQPIRWRWRASRYADWLIQHKSGTREGKNGTVYAVSFRLENDYLEQRQYRYAALVRKYSRLYNVDESLIYAVMKVESSFNPYAVSWANAYGLMQVVPATAGKDVFKLVHNRSGQPGRRYLFDPENNIRTGTAYLHLLQTRYLKDIQDPLSRRHAVISAYNGGAGNVLETFSRDRKLAVVKINQLRPEQVYWALTKRHVSSESRRYLEKVTRAHTEFLSNL
ncbi:membrane-bound lytic murein transglycosylase MltC [Endozoicomonadaceae bacterium StTr2]